MIFQSLWIWLLALVLLMLIIFIELYFIVKRVVLNREFQKQKIKDKKYTSALYRFYVYSKYHNKNPIIDFIADFKKFYELDNLDKLDDEYKEFNINRTIGFSRDISALSYKKQLNANNSNAIDLQNDIINNLEQLNNRLNNIQDLPNVNTINKQEQISSTSSNEQTAETVETVIQQNIQPEPTPSVATRITPSKSNSVSVENKSVPSKNKEAALEKKKEKMLRKLEKKEGKDNKDSSESDGNSPYFNDTDDVVKTKQSRKEILAMEKEKKDKAALKKLMSDI